MTAQEVIRDVGLILIAGLVAAPLAAFLRVPIMIVLVGLGVALGPTGVGLIENPVTGLGAQLVFTFGVSLILFHGGLRTSLRVISRTALSLAALAIPGILVTTLVVALFIAPLFSLPFGVALLLGAVLSATDPAILIPLFDRMRLRPKVAQTVVAESALNDPTATILALTLAAVVVDGQVTFGGPVAEFSKNLVLGTVLGIAAGFLLVALTSTGRSGIWRESPAAAVLGVIAVMYFTTDELGGSAYLGAFVMGLVVSNFRPKGASASHHVALLDTFVAQCAEIATLAIFLTLGINLPLGELWGDLPAGLVVIGALIFVARPLTVLVCLLPDRRASWSLREIAFICWCRETGVVPAALAGLLLAEGVEGAHVAVSLVALAICVTLLLQATTADYVARRLGLLET